MLLAWYSCESFLLVKALVDLIPNVITMVLMALIGDIHYDDFNQTLPALIIVLVLPTIFSQFLGYLYAIIFEERGFVVATLTLCWLLLFSNFILSTDDVSGFIEHIFFNINPGHLGIGHLTALIFGFGRCPDGFISTPMFTYRVDDDMFNKSTLVLTYQSLSLVILTYVTLKIKMNWYLLQNIINNTKNKFQFASQTHL